MQGGVTKFDEAERATATSNNFRDERHSRGGVRRTFEVSKKPGSKGHEVVIKALKEGGRFTTLIFLDDQVVGGTIVAFDKFTITLLVSYTDGVPATRREVYYKHALKGFYGDEPVADRVT